MNSFARNGRGVGLAIAAGLLLGSTALTPAQAADLGGDCCADLEERVAELEATTVRKGNRRMSVTLYGHVHRTVMWWDDGDEENVYVVDNDYSATAFGFEGEADWKPGWKIGFVLEWEQIDEASNAVTAVDDDQDSGLEVSQAVWWVESERLGRVTVGFVDSASIETSEENLSGAGDFAGNSTQSNNAGFLLVRNIAPATPTGVRSTLAWGDISPDNQSGLDTQHGVRYDSPEFGGFTLSGGWYEDDMWDVALRFAKQWNSVEVSAAVGYAVDNEGGAFGFCNGGNGANGVNAPNGGGSTADCEQISASLSLIHAPSGLFFTIAGGHTEDSRRQVDAVANGIAAGVSVDDEASHIYANTGIYRRFNQHGNSSLGVEYYNGECGFGACNNTFAVVDGVGFVSGTETEMVGAWISQEIDNAATTFYLAFNHFEADIDFTNAAGASVTGAPYEDWQTIKAGAIVNF